MNFIWESVIEFTDDIIEPFSEDVWGIRLQVHNNALAYHSKKLEEDSDLVSYLPTARRLRLIKLRMVVCEHFMAPGISDLLRASMQMSSASI